MEIVYIVLFIAYSFNVALIEAIFWHSGAYLVWTTVNKHIFLVLNRAFPLLTVALFKWDVVYILGLFLLSEGVRPSFYYFCRNWINEYVYTKGLLAEPTDESGGKTSVINLTLKIRIILTIFGVLVLLTKLYNGRN